MSFTREDLATYEKGGSKPAPVVAATPDPAIPASDEAPALEIPVPGDSSSPGDPPPDDPAPDGSTAEDAGAAPAADPDGQTPDSNDAAAQRGRNKTVPYERFQEVVEERNALRKFGEYLQTQRAPAASAPVAAVATMPDVPAADDDPPPTLEQFDYDPVTHGKAIGTWLQKQIRKGVSTEVQKLQAGQSAEQVRTAFEARLTEFKKTNLDYDVVMANPNLPQPIPSTARALVTSENGPAMIHHIGKNPDYAVRLSRMSPEQQLMELGRLETKLTAPAAKPATSPALAQPARTRTVTQAPPPPRPVSAGAASSTKNVTDGSMSMAEFVDHERQAKITLREARQKMRQRMR